MVVKKIRIAARQSDLARLQAWAVGTALKTKFNNLEVEYHFRSSLGDQNANDPLWKMPEKGVFTEDFVDDLRSGRVDLVVHSWKDLPIGERQGTRIIGTLERADVRDVLLIRKDRWEEKKLLAREPLRIFTSSPRREHNLKSNLQWLLPLGNSTRPIEFLPVRGNILTRVRKLFGQVDGQRDGADGLIVAKAALDRLLSFHPNGFHGGSRLTDDAAFSEVVKSRELEVGARELRKWIDQTHFVVLPLRVNPTAAAQGALAIEARVDSRDVIEMVEAISDANAVQDVEMERQILASYGGGCHQKIGVTILSRDYGRIRLLQGRTDQGLDLSSIHLLGREESLAESLCSSSNFFYDLQRQPLKWTEPELAVTSGPNARLAYYVSKVDAWPLEGVREGAIVWTSGLETWKALTARGVWVHGSSESLGEHEPKRVEALLGETVAIWHTLTHDSAYRSDPELGETASTRHGLYRIQRKIKTLSECIGLIQKSNGNVNWKSASDVREFFDQFEREATAEQREYLTSRVRHFSGPGWTHKSLIERASRYGINFHSSISVIV